MNDSIVQGVADYLEPATKHDMRRSRIERDLGEHAHYLEHGLAGWVVVSMPCWEGVDFAEERDEVLQGALEAIGRPNHDQVEVPP